MSPENGGTYTANLPVIALTIVSMKYVLWIMFSKSSCKGDCFFKSRTWFHTIIVQFLARRISSWSTGTRAHGFSSQRHAVVSSVSDVSGFEACDRWICKFPPFRDITSFFFNHYTAKKNVHVFPQLSRITLFPHFLYSSWFSMFFMLFIGSLFGSYL